MEPTASQHAQPSQPAFQRQKQAQVRLTRSYDAAPERVWQAWTEPQALVSWFTDGKPAATDSAELDVRVGGHYRVRFTMANGEQNEVFGTYQEVRPFERLVFTWAWGSTPERVSRVSISLAPTPWGSEMRFVHDRFFDDAARANHERGWNRTMAQLDAYLLSLHASAQQEEA